MPKAFYERLFDYFLKVAEVLRGEADAASVFPNAADVGAAREGIYFTFLRQHVPHWCDVIRGGFLFNGQGAESGQLDLIVTSGLSPKFQFFVEKSGKSFSSVDGAIAVVSVKSNLSKSELINAIEGFARIPPLITDPSAVNKLLNGVDLGIFPLQVIYANKGLKFEEVIQTVEGYYRSHPEVPINRRVDIVHVNNTSVSFKGVDGYQFGEHNLSPSNYYTRIGNPDVFAFAFVLQEIQRRAVVMPHIFSNVGPTLESLQSVELNRASMI